MHKLVRPEILKIIHALAHPYQAHRDIKLAPYGKHYTALGSVVNLASRLEGLASRGEILISVDTRRLVAPLIDCTSRGQMAVRGFSHLISTFTVNGSSENTVNSQEVRLLS